MDTINVQFLIPTCNHAKEIDDTLQSIWDQDYSHERIYVTAKDFGSTDGTYEKLLRHENYHFGIYREPFSTNRRQRISRMAMLMEPKLNYVYPGGPCFLSVLYPGDVLYPEFLRTCTDAFFRQGVSPSMVICEADCRDGGGEVHHQAPLFETDCILRDPYQYISRGYRHQVQCMVSSLDVRLTRFACAANEQRWWNKCDVISGAGNALYIEEPLLCQKQVVYEDELEEVLLRWESVIARSRAAEGRRISEQAAEGRRISLWRRLLRWWRRRKAVGKRPPAQDQGSRRSVEANIAEYALWRSWLVCRRNGNRANREAEDCFLISRAIDPGIADSELYRNMQRYVVEGDGMASGYLEEYFSTHGMS